MPPKRCECCGQPLPQYVDATWEAREARRAYLGDVAFPDVPFAEYEKWTPARAPSPAGDVAVPFLQALISGVAVTLLGIAVLYAAGGNVRWAFVVGAAVATIAWFQLLADSRQLLRTVERIVGTDIDGDGHVGEPDPEPPPPFRVEVRQKQSATGSTTSYIDLPSGIDRDVMRDVARAVLLPDGAFSRPYLCDQRGLLTQTQYAELRRTWLDAGLVAEAPGNRTELTAAGRAVMRAFRDEE